MSERGNNIETFETVKNETNVDQTTNCSISMKSLLGGHMNKLVQINAEYSSSVL